MRPRSFEKSCDMSGPCLLLAMAGRLRAPVLHSKVHGHYCKTQLTTLDVLDEPAGYNGNTRNHK